MRSTIDHEQRKFFLKNGWIEFESLLQKEEGNALVKEIGKIFPLYKGSPEEEGRFLSRYIPQIVRLIRKKGLGEIAFELLGYKPLRLAYDHAFQSLPDGKLQFPDIFPMTHEECGLLLHLEGEKAGHGIFFAEKGRESLYIDLNHWYLLLVFTRKYLNPDFHPIVYQ